MTESFSIIALAKNDERYIFIFDDANRINVIRQLGFYAADPELSFSWTDAYVMARRIRQTESQY